MVFDVFGPLVMESFQKSIHGKTGLAFQDFRCVLPRAVFVSELCATGGEEGIMQLGWRRDAPKGRNRFGIAPCHEERAAEMIPEPLRMAGIEAHGLFDPSDSLFRLSDPGQDFALLHDDK